MTERKRSFDTAAEIYDETRLAYPAETIDWIFERTKTPIEETLLEIGPGTGQATLRFAEKGYKIHCVEIGKNLADILVKKVKDMTSALM